VHAYLCLRHWAQRRRFLGGEPFIAPLVPAEASKNPDVWLRLAVALAERTRFAGAFAKRHGPRQVTAARVRNSGRSQARVATMSASACAASQTSA
jgi:hypothetical protein